MWGGCPVCNYSIITGCYWTEAVEQGILFKRSVEKTINVITLFFCNFNVFHFLYFIKCRGNL